MTLEQLVRFTVVLDKADMKRYIGYYYRRSIFLQIISFLAVALLFSLLLHTLLSDNSISFFSVLDPLIVIFLALIILLPFVIYFLLLNTARKNGLFDKRIYTITKDRVRLETNEKEIGFSVSSLVRIVETRNTFYLWQQNAPQILPKRFMSESDIKFLQTLKD